MIVEEKFKHDIDIDKLSHESVQDEESLEDRYEERISTKTKNIIREQEFPHNLSTTKNSDPANYRPIYFKNYIPIHPEFLIDKLPHFEKISQIENYYERKMKKGVKEFLNLEKNPLTIVPKKNNIDLKRNLAQKLEKLNKKTELVILELIRENIQNQKRQFEDGEEENKMDNKSDNISKEESGSLGNRLVMATQMQMNMQEEELKKDYSEDEEESEISSDYDKGINEL